MVNYNRQLIISVLTARYSELVDEDKSSVDMNLDMAVTNVSLLLNIEVLKKIKNLFK